MNVQEYLGRHNVSFDALKHAPTYEAQRMAGVVHVSGHEVAKTVLLRTDVEGTYVVAMLPATHHVDLQLAREALGCAEVELASEQEMSQRCPDCEVGALPPFGSWYGMKTLVDTSLAQEPEIVFESTKHDEAIKMKYADFERLEQPQVAAIAYHGKT